MDELSDMDTAFALARTHGLSFYDATYLELGERRKRPRNPKLRSKPRRYC